MTYASYQLARDHIGCKQGITIDRDYEMPKDPLPNVDADQLEVALYNIFSNASEALGTAGTLKVKTRVVSGTEGRVLMIEISDTGGGIPPEEVENIFNPFYTTKHWGTGLGLTMTHRIVENHGGDIRVLVPVCPAAGRQLWRHKDRAGCPDELAPVNHCQTALRARPAPRRHPTCATDRTLSTTA